MDNPLAECVDIHPVHRQEMDNLTILKTTVTLKKSIGECGCFSTLISYTSLLAQDVEGYGRGSAYSLQEGNISLAKMQGRYPFSFVLSVDNQSVRDQKLALMIRCTPPL
ncbi:DUF2195 family protein [Salmonella enterica subsp. enterica serovar Kentucky]|nr:DUF2195 family protein [Salmonella enterica subsp. enterica serovar Kentucky]